MYGLPEGASILVETERWLLWSQAHPPFPERPVNAHQIRDGRIASSGVYDLTADEALELIR